MSIGPEPDVPHMPQPQEEEWYDLTSAEKKLIGWSLGLGIALLVVFVLVTYVFFPAPK